MAKQNIVVALDGNERKAFKWIRTVMFNDGSGGYLRVTTLPDGTIDLWSPTGFTITPTHQNRLSIRLTTKKED